jgi:TPR repeat protein
LGWFKKAADLGDGPSQYQEGLCYRWSWGVANDKQKTAELMAQSATNGGGPLAETYIGWCYEMHYGVEKNMSEAIRWYRKASDAGEPWAQNNLADCYSEGTYIERNLLKAAQLYKKSAAGGYATGMYRWAECLRNGWGTVKNEQEALVWYRKAADEGEDSAKKFLRTLNRATNTCPAKTP